MSDLTIGYAAMLEQFHPTEAVALTALAEEHGFSGCMAADHFQPWVPAAGPGVVRVERADRRRRAHPRRHGPRRHLPVVPVPPGDGGPGRRDARGDVPRPHLAGRRRGRGPQRARDRRLLARGRRALGPHVRGDRDHQEALRRLHRRQGRQAQGHLLPDGVDPAVDHAGGRSPGARGHRRADQREEDRQVRRRDHHRRGAAGEDRRPVRQVRGGRARGRQGPRHACPRCCSCTCPGRPPTRRP